MKNWTDFYDAEGGEANSISAPKASMQITPSVERHQTGPIIKR